MPFIHKEGETGLFFVPEDNHKKKHSCCDCFSCQWCDDARCEICLHRQKCSGADHDNPKSE